MDLLGRDLRGASGEEGEVMKRFHFALNVRDLKKSVRDYSRRLGCKPSVIIPKKYALWRTSSLNFSIRVASPAGKLRHLGWEVGTAKLFSKNKDKNGVIWERFTAAQQRAEIRALWP